MGERTFWDPKKEPVPTAVLTICRMSTGYAVYHGDGLIYEERGPAGLWPVGLLRNLGHRVEFFDIDSGEGSRDFWHARGYAPPPTLSELREAWAIYDLKRKKGRLDTHRAEVARLVREVADAEAGRAV